MSDATTKSWEERVIALEAQGEEQRKLLAKKEDELTAALARVESLEATVKVHQDAEAARRLETTRSYVAGLKTEACEANSPIPEADLARVEAAFQRGDDETARALGDAFLTRSKALGGASPRGDAPRVIDLGPTSEDEKAHQKEMAEFAKRWPSLAPKGE